MSLSVIIITKNEEENIGRCLASCQKLKAECIVIDSFSTDNTKNIATSYGAQVISTEWKGYGATKNYGASLAQNDWILSIDADEAVSSTLSGQILDALKDSKVIAYWLKRDLIYNHKALAFGATKNEWRLRLYNRKYMQWNDKEVHEDLEPFDQDIEYGYGQLQGNLLHFSYNNKKDMYDRLEKYARLNAQQMHAGSKTYASSKKWLNSIFYFIKNYIFLRGFLDGRNGFEVALAQANYVYKKYKYLEEL